jgi:hypothetical protein
MGIIGSGAGRTKNRHAGANAREGLKPIYKLRHYPKDLPSVCYTPLPKVSGLVEEVLGKAIRGRYHDNKCTKKLLRESERHGRSLKKRGSPKETAPLLTLWAQKGKLTYSL